MKRDFRYYYWLESSASGEERILGRSNDPRIAQAAAEKIAFEGSLQGSAILVRSEEGEEIYRVPTGRSMS